MRSVAAVPRRPRLRELRALVGVMARFWIVVLPLARTELRGWRARAAAIPDPGLRAQALTTLDSERLSAAGAALFAATAPRTRRRAARALVRALVAYQVICDYLDTLAEQPSADPIANGARLHRALVDAVDDAPHADHYGLHRAREDGGYLAALVGACRAGCATLPAWDAVRALAVGEAARNEVQGINHAPADVREPALRRWARAARADAAAGDAAWFELAAAGSSSLAVLALIAAAADPATGAAGAERVRTAYFPWVEALSTLLDSVADRERDLRSGELSFVGQHPSQPAAAARLAQVAARALAGARDLPRGERHVVLVAGMIAMHLSDPGARLPWARPVTEAVLDAADTPAMAPLLAVLRVWRRARGERAAPAPSAQLAVSPTGQLTPVPPSPQ
jgi:tetraprenyl-beta-curcumene synthase